MWDDTRDWFADHLAWIAITFLICAPWFADLLVGPE